MTDTFLALITAHLLADFPFQPDWLLKRKKKLGILLLHTLIVVTTAAFILGAVPCNSMIH